MVKSIRTRPITITLLLAAVALHLNSCGKMPVSSTPTSEGYLEIRAAISTPLAKGTASAQTLCDSLIVEVSAPDMGKIRQARKIDLSNPVVCDTLSRIPTGSHRLIKISTVNKRGQVVHIDSAGDRTISVGPNENKVIYSHLIAALGSIYLQLLSIPTNVDSVIAEFTTLEGRIYGTRVKRSTKLFFSIDDIPHGASGTLSVSGLSVTGEPLYTTSVSLKFDARKLQSIPLNFSAAPGGMAMEIAIDKPGVTVAGGTMGEGYGNNVSESGRFIITEIMYAANDSEYVEIFNPYNDTTLDTLVVELDGTPRVFTNVAIGSGNSFLIGRKLFPWVTTAHPVFSALDLSSTGGWIVIRSSSGEIFDRVVFTGGSNSLEWPSFSGKRAIIFSSETNSPDDNNYGRNWTAAQDLVPETTALFGTPGKR